MLEPQPLNVFCFDTPQKDELEGNIHATKRRLGQRGGVAAFFERSADACRSWGQLPTLPLRVPQSPELNSGPLLLRVTPLETVLCTVPRFLFLLRTTERGLRGPGRNPTRLLPRPHTCIQAMRALLQALPCGLSQSTQPWNRAKL